MLAAERPFRPVQWAVLIGSLVLIGYSIGGLIINPDFTVGDGATSQRFLGVDMNGWHALSGLLLGGPGLVAALQVRLAALFAVVAAGGVFGVGIWILFTETPVFGLLYLPNTAGDVILHTATAAIFAGGAAHHHLTAQRV